MTDRDQSQRAFELAERLGNLLRSREREAGREDGLQPVHLQALWFIARSNRYSNTPSVVAEYLGVTRGTTSTTLKVLREKGLLASRPDPDDARVTRLELTAAGRRVHAHHLASSEIEAIREDLSADAWETFENAAEDILRALQRRSDVRTFGICNTCRHFRDDGPRCGLTGESLAIPETELLCREHEPPGAE